MPKTNQELEVCEVTLQLISIVEKYLKIYDTENFEEKNSLLDELLEIDSKNIEVLFLKAKALEDVGQLEGALEAYNYALSKDPENKDILSEMGNILRVLKEDNNALKYYNQALEIDPEDLHLWKVKENIFLGLNKNKEADLCNLIHRSFKFHPGNFEKLDDIYWEARKKDINLEEKKFVFSILLSFRPDEVKYFISYGETLEENGEYYKALDLYKNEKEKHGNLYFHASEGLLRLKRKYNIVIDEPKNEKSLEEKDTKNWAEQLEGKKITPQSFTKSSLRNSV